MTLKRGEIISSKKPSINSPGRAEHILPVLRQWLCVQHSYSTHHDSLSTQLAPHLDYERPGRHTGHPLQYSCLENPMDRGVWQASPYNHRAGHDWRDLAWMAGTKPPRLCVLSCSVVFDFFVTPWTVAHQAPRSTGFSRQEYWSGLPIPPPDGKLRDAL